MGKQAELQRAALTYIRANGCRPRMAIFPIKPRAKTPIEAGGFYAASTDEETVRAAWTKTPNANIGFWTKGIVVLDVDRHDPASDGAESLHDLESQFGELPETWIALTPTGGAHYYFRCDDQRLTSGAGIRPGIDYRGCKGYVLLPPSVHPNGGRYEWDAGHKPNETPLADLPEWLHKLMLEKSAEKQSGGPIEVPETISRGARNEKLFGLACSLRHKGLTAEEMLATIQSVNIGRCKPPLEDQELRKICESAAKYERGEISRGSQRESGIMANGYSDAGNAAAIVEKYSDGLTPDSGSATEEKPKLSTISAEDLENEDLPPILFAIKKLVAHGLSLLASPPKFGKSWMALQMCLSVSQGWRFLGYETNQCRCLYLALEDSKQRLQTRMKVLLAGRKAPKQFDFAVSCHTLDNGFLDELENYVREKPDTGMIVIDTLQKIRGATRNREGAYAADYREMAALKAFADSHHIALVLIHHLRKMGDDGDPFNRISGTNGIFGAADTAMVLTREKRRDSETIMSVVGRDAESAEIVLSFDKDSGKWVNEGDVDDVMERKALEAYRESPLVLTVKKLLDQSPEKRWIGTATDLMNAGKYIVRGYISTSVKALSKDIKANERFLLEYDGIIHSTRKNGNAGVKHVFSYKENPAFTEQPEDEELPFL